MRTSRLEHPPAPPREGTASPVPRGASEAALLPASRSRASGRDGSVACVPSFSSLFATRLPWPWTRVADRAGGRRGPPRRGARRRDVARGRLAAEERRTRVPSPPGQRRVFDRARREGPEAGPRRRGARGTRRVSRRRRVSPPPAVSGPGGRIPKPSRCTLKCGYVSAYVRVFSECVGSTAGLDLQ